MPVPLWESVMHSHHVQAFFFYVVMSDASIIAKPFLPYQKQLALLQSRGMVIDDLDHALKKLEEISYYRLSGFWYVFRQVVFDNSGNIIRQRYNPNIPKRLDEFYPGTAFNDVLDLYLFDKNLRLLILDALERIEIYIRALIAYEMGKSDPMAYENDRYIDAVFLSVPQGKNFIPWEQWKKENQAHLDRSHEDCIKWHRESGRQIPIWVLTEAWDFGLMSKYFSMLKRKYKNKICFRIDRNLTPDVLNNWLFELNILRNRCAHHTRIWNQTAKNPLLIPNIPYFQRINLSINSRKKLCGLIAVMWFIVHKIGSSSSWLDKVGELIELQSEKDYFKTDSMGFMQPVINEFLLFKYAVV